MPPILRLLPFLLLACETGNVLRGEDTLKPLLEKLTHRARQTRQGLGTYPAINPKLRTQHPNIRSEQVLWALGRRLDPDPSLDGYLKLQLLEFGPNLFHAKPQQHLAIVLQMPTLMTYPQPSASQLALLETAEVEVLPLRVVKTKIKPLLEGFKRALQRSAERNRCSMAYHQKIIHRMPSENGMQLLAKLVSAHHHYQGGWWVAGSKRYTLTRQIVADAREMWHQQRSIHPWLRNFMHQVVVMLHQAQPIRGQSLPIQEMHMGDDGRLKILRKPRCFPVDNKLYEDLRRYVSGPRL